MSTEYYGWLRIDRGLIEHQSDLRGQCGIFRILRNGKTMYVGKGADKKGGLAKRLRDFSRPSASGRNHYAGMRINEDINSLQVEVLLLGSGIQARNTAKKLKKLMIKQLRPLWNV